MSKKKIVIPIIIVVIIFIALIISAPFLMYENFREPYVSEIAPRPSAISEAGSPIPASKSADLITVQDRMVIFNGYISLETEDIDGTLDKIRSLTIGYDGYVAGISRSTAGNQARAEITIRIPQNKFQAAIDDIEKYGKLLDERTTSEDVTEQYIDLKARVNNLKSLEQSLTELLDKAITVEEILKVEKELARIRGEIDSLQGQINYLERNVTMSLLRITLTEPPSPFTPPGMNWGDTFEMAIRGLFAVISGLIIFVISVLPIVVIIAIPAYFLHRRKLKKQEKNE